MAARTTYTNFGYEAFSPAKEGPMAEMKVVRFIDTDSAHIHDFLLDAESAKILMEDLGQPPGTGPRAAEERAQAGIPVFQTVPTEHVNPDGTPKL